MFMNQVELGNAVRAGGRKAPETREAMGSHPRPGQRLTVRGLVASRQIWGCCRASCSFQEQVPRAPRLR